MGSFRLYLIRSKNWWLRSRCVLPFIVIIASSVLLSTPRVTIEMPIFLVVELFSNLFNLSEFVFSRIPIIIDLVPFEIERRLCIILLEIVSIAVIIMANVILILAIVLNC